jgi:lactate dehydrogenase-like 2-hydroxyacid dehydrogenase
MALALTGHLGVQVADLIDGRLPAHVEERAWQHVMVCAGCRSRVEAEGWAKQALSGLRDPAPYPGPAPTELVGSLRDLRALPDLDEWTRSERPQRSLRRTSLALVGAGGIGAAVFGIAALTAPPTIAGDVPGGPASIRHGIPQTAGSGPAGSDAGTAGTDRLRRTSR